MMPKWVESATGSWRFQPVIAFGATACDPASATMRVKPSAGCRRSHSDATAPEAPGRFSTTTRVPEPSCAPIRSASSRAAVSVEPPGA